MKKSVQKSVLRSASLMVMFVLLLTGSLAAQSGNTISELDENSLGNLQNGIRSDNDGLKRSSVYLAGYYKIEAVVPALREQLLVEKNPANRVLIALTLNEIGNAEALSVLESLASKDENEKVRKVSTAILKDFISRTNQLAGYSN